MGNKRLEWIFVSSLIVAISSGIVFGTISLGSQSNKTDSHKNKTEQTEDKDKNTEKHKKDDLNNDSAYTDGVYEGSARGYSSDVTVKVTIKDGKIEDIEVVSEDETPEYFNEAVKVLDDIIDADSTDVDSISGATISSEALKEAVQNALQKAEKKGTSKKGKSKKNKNKNKNKKKSSSRSRKSRSSGAAIGHSSGPARSLASSSVNIPEGGRLKDGSYQGSASGYRGNISVSVSVRDGKIAGVDILSYNDDDAYFNSALAVINRMIGQTSANVDSVSGATYSSMGIINAVNDALNKAVEGPSASKNNKRKANSKAKNKPVAQNKKTENGKKTGSESHDKPSTLSPLPPKEGKLKDGTYTGSARGFKGNIGVSVTIKDGKIASVDITSSGDDQAYLNSARGVINKMIGKQSGTVDSISGATYSSVGIMNAVNDAINKAIDNSTSKIPSLPTPAPSPLPTPSPSPSPSPLPPKEGKLKDGTYNGFARGFKGNIGVSVTIKDGKIASVDITTNGDDQAYFNSARGVINKMIGKQSGTVDSISGATYSSVGIMNAVNDAINKAIDDSSSKIPSLPTPNPSLPPLPQPQPDPGSEEKPGEKPQPSPGSEEKPGEKPQPSPGSEEKPGEKPQSKEEKALEEKIRRGDLAEGSFDGEGSGYNTGKGKVKTKVVIKDGKIIDIVRDEASYPDDGDQFRTTSAKIIKFLKDPVNGKRNIAIMKMHMDMVEQIANASDPVAKARELVGDYGANYIKNNKDNPSFPLRAYASYAVKAYLLPKYKAKEMYDAVSGATLSAGGTALSVDAALAKAENDKKTNSNIDSIEIVENKDALIERNFYTHKVELLSNKADLLDLSDLQVKLIYKDKKEEIVSYKDFAKHGLEIKGEDGKAISDKMNFTDEVKNKKVLNATITHKDSKRSVDLAIKFGLYSKDYIKKMEYSLDDGKNWTEIANPALSDENKKNIADKQNIKLKKDELGKQILVKTITVSGKTYTYKSDKDGVKFDRIRLLCTDNSYEKNNNASFAVFLVVSEDKSSPSKPEHQVDPQKPETEASDGDIDLAFAPKNLNHRKIDELTIKTGDGVTITSADGLPDGLRLEGNKIVGTIEIEDDKFTDLYRQIDVTIHATKDGNSIKKTFKMDLYQDKDRDGVDDNEEGEEGSNVFTPTTHDGKTPTIEKVRGEAEPTLDEYKALFNNIPNDGSVNVEIVRKPDMSTKGPQAIAKLKFTSTYVSGVSYKSIAVKLVAAKAKADPKAQLEKTIENLTLRSELLSGEFIGYGVGFDLSRGKLKTIVEIDHGDIKKVTFVEGKGYSGMDYMTKSSKAIPYLAGVNGKRNVAILRAHENYVNQIMAVEDMDKRKKKAEELLGKKYADSITDLRRPEMISPLVREFMAGNLGGESKQMLDAVTGATLTSGGLGQSVDNALRMSAHDKETGNDIKEINIVEPSDVNGITGQRVLKQDRSKALDLSRLKLELVDKNGNKKVIEYKDFKTNGIEIKDRDTGKKLENNTQLTNDEMNQAIIADITHKGSMRSTDFAIQFETYSDDYIVGMEYKFDGGNWQELVNPAKDANNVSYRQTIKINDANLGKVASFRLKTKSGKTYDYTCDSPISDYGFKYTFLKDKDVATDNPNANFALYITFEKEGATESKPDIEKPDDESGEDSDYEIPKDAKEVEASDINANLAPFYINYKEITPITISAGQGVTIEDVEGLPEGLDFVNGSISGELYSEDSFGSMKEYPITIYGKKDGKSIKRTLKLIVYQDKDRDGTSAMDEGEDGDMMFNPTWSARKIDKKVGDPAPTVDEYMNLITNLPDDGSVTIEPLSTPNMESKGTNKVRMKVKSTNVQKESTVTILVVVS